MRLVTKGWGLRLETQVQWQPVLGYDSPSPPLPLQDPTVVTASATADGTGGSSSVGTTIVPATATAEGIGGKSALALVLVLAAATAGGAGANSADSFAIVPASTGSTGVGGGSSTPLVFVQGASTSQGTGGSSVVGGRLVVGSAIPACTGHGTAQSPRPSRWHQGRNGSGDGRHHLLDQPQRTLDCGGRGHRGQ